jgi:acyl dehydratase
MADPVLLFRYSALTFNGHRIHYDRDYVTKVEGYPGLIVHGPLQASLLIEFAAKLRGASRPRNSSIAASARCSTARNSASTATRRLRGLRSGPRTRRACRP